MVSRGFTLTELVVVVLISSILSFMAIPPLNDVIKIHQVNRSTLELLTIIQNAAATAKSENQEVAVYLNQAGTNTLTTRYWVPDTSLTINSPYGNYLVMTPDGSFRQTTGSTIGYSLPSHNIKICLPDPQDSSECRIIVVDRKMIYIPIN